MSNGALEYGSHGLVDSGIGHLSVMRHDGIHASKGQMKAGRKVQPFLTLENAAFRLGERVIFENSRGAKMSCWSP